MSAKVKGMQTWVILEYYHEKFLQVSKNTSPYVHVTMISDIDLATKYPSKVEAAYWMGIVQEEYPEAYRRLQVVSGEYWHVSINIINRHGCYKMHTLHFDRETGEVKCREYRPGERQRYWDLNEAEQALAKYKAEIPEEELHRYEFEISKGNKVFDEPNLGGY